MSLSQAKKRRGESRRIHLFNFGCIEYQPGVRGVSGSFELAAFPGTPTTRERSSVAERNDGRRQGSGRP